MLTLHAHQTGSLAAKAPDLKEDSSVGHVIASFPNSFYVKMRNDQLLFITNLSLRSPITINVKYSGNFTNIVKPLEPVSFYKRRLCTTDLSIEVTGANDEDEKFLVDKELPYPKLMQDSILLSTILNLIENSRSSLDQNQPIVHDSISNFVRHGLLPLRDNGSMPEFAAAAGKIVGLGLGFTPSGDDLLLGFLVIYNSLSPAIARTPVYLGFELLARRTSWISAKLLDYAQHLQVDGELLRVIRSTLNPAEDTVLALETLISRGHTSGIDIVTGAVLGLSVVCDIALRGGNTEIIAAKLGLL